MKLYLRTKLPWWTDYYIRSCWLFAYVTGMEPDWDKMSARILRHTRVTVSDA